MQDWNVVVTVHEGRFNRAKQLLRAFGELGETDYFNLLVMKVDDIGQFLEEVRAQTEVAPDLGDAVGRIMPASATFDFQMPAEFEAQVVHAVEPWVAKLAGGSFHVRMHRRGFKGRLSSQDEERFVDRFLMAKLDQQGAAGSIDFDDPDYIIDIETVSQRAGVALWSRGERLRYPFLKLD